jgi:hypothetical protein
MKQMISVWKLKKNGDMRLKWKKKKVSPISYLSHPTSNTPVRNDEHA